MPYSVPSVGLVAGDNYQSTTASVYVAMRAADVAGVITSLSTPGASAVIKEYYWEYLTSLRLYPFDITKYLASGVSVQSGLKIGAKTTTAGGYPLNGLTINVTTPYMTLATFSIPDPANYWYRAPACHYDLYLPLVGYRSLDINEIIGKTVTVRLYPDLYTGRGMYYVLAGDVVIDQVGVQLAIDIPLSGIDAAAQNRNIMAGLTGMVGAISAIGVAGAAGNVAGVVSGGVAALNSYGTMMATPPAVNRGDRSDGLTGWYGPMEPYIRRRTIVPSYSRDWLLLNGRPANYVTTLSSSTLSGYTEVGTMHLEGSGFASATIDERDELERLLKAGVRF